MKPQSGWLSRWFTRKPSPATRPDLAAAGLTGLEILELRGLLAERAREQEDSRAVARTLTARDRETLLEILDYLRSTGYSLFAGTPEDRELLRRMLEEYAGQKQWELWTHSR